MIVNELFHYLYEECKGGQFAIPSYEVVVEIDDTYYQIDEATLRVQKDEGVRQVVLSASQK